MSTPRCCLVLFFIILLFLLTSGGRAAWAQTGATPPVTVIEAELVAPNDVPELERQQTFRSRWRLVTGSILTVIGLGTSVAGIVLLTETGLGDSGYGFLQELEDACIFGISTMLFAGVILLSVGIVLLVNGSAELRRARTARARRL